MKKLLTPLCLLLILNNTSAQPIICSGNPLVGINGNSYDSIAATGTDMYGMVANTKNGKLFANHGGKIRYIDPSNFSIMDSMDLDINYFAGAQSNDTMFGLTDNGTVCRFNVTSKSFIDSLPIAGQYHSRVTERPGAKEVWVSGAPVAVVDYTGAMTAGTTFPLGTNTGVVKFSSDGLTAYTNSGVTKRIYIINAATKVVTDSLDTSPESPGTFELSADDSKLFVAVTGKIRVYQTSTLTLIDSVNVTMATMNMYRHPSRPEIWCVHHFADSVSIFNANTHALIDSLPVGGSPFFLAFGQVGTGVKNINKAAALHLYPNPATTTVHVELPLDCETVGLYNLAGELLDEHKTANKIANVDVAQLPAGYYILKATTKDGNSHSGSFIKQ